MKRALHKAFLRCSKLSYPILIILKLIILAFFKNACKLVQNDVASPPYLQYMSPLIQLCAIAAIYHQQMHHPPYQIFKLRRRTSDR